MPATIQVKSWKVEIIYEADGHDSLENTLNMKKQ